MPRTHFVREWRPADVHDLAMDYAREIGRKLRERRHARGWTLEELAERTESLSPSAISNYEQGIRTPKPGTLVELARALDVAPARLAGLDDESTLSAAERTLLERFRQTDARGRDQILSTAAQQPTADHEQQTERDGLPSRAGPQRPR